MHLAVKLRLSLLHLHDSSSNHWDAFQSPRALNFAQVENFSAFFLSHFLSFLFFLLFFFFSFLLFFDDWKVGSFLFFSPAALEFN